MTDYHTEYRRSLDDPESYWAEQADRVAWFKRPSKILSRDGDYNNAWFVDGELNSCYLAVDHHIANERGDQTALIYDSPATGSIARYTFLELRDEVSRLAGLLVGLNVSKGDRVIIYMPMIPQAVFAMLACARIGAIHSVVFGGFASKELAARIDDAAPKVILAASCGIEFNQIVEYKPLIDEAVEIAEHIIEHCVVWQREQSIALLDQPYYKEWQSLLAEAPLVDPIALVATDPLYILYTSGTTGKPKGVVRDNGSHAVALLHSMELVYNIQAGEVFWAASDVGWVVGHSYIVYAPLFAGCSTIVFEGKPVRTPDAGTFWRVISDHKVNVFFTAPTAFRAIRKEDPEAAFLKQHDISSLRTQFVAGERTDPSTYEWLVDNLGVPVIDHWWQTETGWPMAGNPLGIEMLPARVGSVTMPIPGFDIHILSDLGESLSAGKQGDVAVKLPLPPGCLSTIWGDHKRFHDSYLSRYLGYYNTGDEGFIDEDGYLFIMGRTDDVMNVAGHRLSTGQMEEAVAAHPAVAECAVIAIEDVDKGQVPAGLVIVKDGVNIAQEELRAELIAMVRKDVGAFANFKRVVVVSRLPKTRSGKILRQVIRKIADNKPYETPATIDDPNILDEILVAFQDARVGKVSGDRLTSSGV